MGGQLGRRMSRSKINKAKRVCVRKARYTHDEAIDIAEYIGNNTEAFYCIACHYWHVGTPTIKIAKNDIKTQGLDHEIFKS